VYRKAVNREKTEVGSRKTEDGSQETESGRRKSPVRVFSIPEGLHVYRKTVNRENSTPMGVVPSANVWCYKHLMPLASANPPTGKFSRHVGKTRDKPAAVNTTYRKDE
jgi:hypothetical protein